MLRVTLLGNLGADPEVRFTTKGTQMVSFRVAVNQVRRGPDGERQENTDWFRVRVAGPQSEFAQRLTKGTRVLAIGRLVIGQYQTKDGESRTSFDVWADEVQSVSGPRGGGFGSEPEGMPSESDAISAQPALAGANGRKMKSEDLEDLPF